MLKKCFQYRLNLKTRAEQELNQIISECCWLYNYFLQIRREWDQKKQKQPTKNEQEKLLIQLKEQRPQLKLIFSQVLQNVANRVNEAWKNHRQHKRINLKAGYPRFKQLSKYNSFTYKQFGFKLMENKLILSCGREKKELFLNVRLHRELESKIKTLSIVRKNGKYYACFVGEVEEKILPATNKKVGIDLGLINFAATSDKQLHKNPRTYKQAEKELIETQQRLSGKVKRSKNWLEAKLLLAKKWEKVVNQRKDQAYRIAKELVANYDNIAVEDLKIKKMLERKDKKRSLRKSIQNTGWGIFVNSLARKVEETGGQLVKVNPRNTSQLCSSCGEITKEKLKLSQRKFKCCYCENELDRDINSARNILKLAEPRFGASLRT